MEYLLKSCHTSGVRSDWLKKGVHSPEESDRRRVRAYLAKGGDRGAGSYREFVTALILEMADTL